MNTVHRRKGLGLIEVVIALVIAVAAGIPILRMVMGSRTETSSSVNYLRAVELADEALEWASVSQFSEVDKLKNLSGSIIEDGGSGMTTCRINIKEAGYQSWKDSEIFKTELSYSPQYTTAFFYREIEVEPVEPDSEAPYISKNLLKKVTVTVKWCEGYKPSNLNLPSDRNRQVQLSMLVINDENLLN